MKFKNFFSVPALLIVLLSMSCSQHRVVNWQIFSEELKRLEPSTLISVQDRSGQTHRGVLMAPVQTLPDSTQVLVLNCKRDGAPHEFKISSNSSATEVTAISTRCKTEAENVFMGGLLGAMGGAPLGALLGEVTKSQYDDTGAPRVYGGVLGFITGFISGAVIGNSLPRNCVLVLDPEAANHNPIHSNGK